MILSDRDLRKAIKAGRLVIAPPPLRDFSASAIDLRVGRKLWKWREEPESVTTSINCTTINIQKLEQYAEPITPDANGFVSLEADDFVLAPTLETIHLPVEGRLAARVEGRSTLARLGLGVHITAPIIHSGFQGRIVLEFMNHGRYTLKLEAGVTRVCQIVVEHVSSKPTGNLNKGSFFGQTGPFGKK